MPKNLVICCDGTNNSFEKDLTNVARLSRVAVNTPGLQHVYYDVGVGVEAAPGLMTQIGQTLSKWSGLAFGSGLVENVTEAYLELIDHYEEHDRIYLFGFSRGAYTVRVLCGLMHRYGLLARADRGMAREVVSLFQGLFPREGSFDDSTPELRQAYCARTFARAEEIKARHSVPAEVHFLGLWDTVSSLGWAYDPKSFPNTARMPNVKIVRHAMALDERRAKFRTNRVTPLDAGGQDLLEVWFSGVHCDVGGGYPEAESGLAKRCMRWMLAEAVQAGLIVDADLVKALDLDRDVDFDHPYFMRHESLKGPWWALEYVRLPHRRQDPNQQWFDEMIRYGGQGWRSIHANDLVNKSVDCSPKPFVVKNRHWADFHTQIQWKE